MSVTVSLESVELDVVGKFKLLTDAALGTKSFYMRAKDTLRELFSDDKNWSNDYAKMASNMVGNAEASTTASMMQLAITWAKEEKELAYSLSLTKAQIALTMTQTLQAEATTTQIGKETEFKAAQIKVAIAGSIRENGSVATTDTDGNPLTLNDNGLKFSQIGTQQASMYSTLADAYRKSGVVDIGTTIDGVKKGTTGDAKGYTWAQDKFALRQIISFEDSKRHQAGNVLSSMIGQMLSSETPPAAEDVARLRTAIDYLNTNSPVA